MLFDEDGFGGDEEQQDGKVKKTSTPLGINCQRECMWNHRNRLHNDPKVSWKAPKYLPFSLKVMTESQQGSEESYVVPTNKSKDGLSDWRKKILVVYCMITTVKKEGWR